MDGIGQAFQFVDHARTRALTAPWDLRRRSNTVSDKVRTLRESLRSDHLRLFQAGQTSPDSLFQKIKRSEQQLMHELLEGEFREDEPPPTPSFPEMLELPADEVLLEYFLKDRSVSVSSSERDCWSA